MYCPFILSIRDRGNHRQYPTFILAAKQDDLVDTKMVVLFTGNSIIINWKSRDIAPYIKRKKGLP
ncbi:hypothetical protein SY88_21775 [Clostridiales bacterium PH28_bin88]|nr:hypothetical protein SY88_21775 [Clostridiales bacterium PH28_bin88]